MPEPAEQETEVPDLKNALVAAGGDGFYLQKAENEYDNEQIYHYEYEFFD